MKLWDWPEHQLKHDVFTEETNQGSEQSQRHRTKLVDMQTVKGQGDTSTSSDAHQTVDCKSLRYLERCVDPADQCVQYVHVVMRVQQDEGQEGLEEGGLRDGAQEQVQVRRGGHHLLYSQLLTHTHTNSYINNDILHVFKCCCKQERSRVPCSGDYM